MNFSEMTDAEIRRIAEECAYELRTRRAHEVILLVKKFHEIFNLCQEAGIRFTVSPVNDGCGNDIAIYSYDQINFDY